MDSVPMGGVGQIKMPISWKDSVHDPDKFANVSRIHYNQHLKENWPCFTWKKELPHIQKHLNENQDIVAEQFKGSFSLDGNLDHAVYEESKLEQHGIKDIDSLTEMLQDELDLKYVEVIYNIQRPGSFVAPHVDGNNPFINRCPFDFDPNQMARFTVFASEWKFGQVWMLGTESVTNWKKFSVIQFPWYMPHATANTSTYDRHTLSVTGIKK